MVTEAAKKDLNLPPVVEGKTFVGSARDFVEDPLTFYEENIPKYGDVFQMKSVFLT